jgi:RHS repeat-associated protein
MKILFIPLCHKKRFREEITKNNNLMRLKYTIILGLLLIILSSFAVEGNNGEATVNQYNDFHQNWYYTQFIDNSVGGGGGDMKIDITNNLLTVTFSAGFSANKLKNGNVVSFTTSPGLPNIELGFLTLGTTFNNDVRVSIKSNAIIFEHAAGNNNQLYSSAYGTFQVNLNSIGGGETENMNWITYKAFDITGTPIASSKTYFDELGKEIQSQSIDTKTGRTWASQTIYDAQGRPALQSLSAPINNTGNFLYNPNFIKKTNGVTYSSADFETTIESPEPVGNTANTLGWYYSNNNTTESYQDISSYPFSRTIYSELNPGAVKKVIGGNKIENEWKSGYVFSMKAGQELSQSVAFGDGKYNSYKIIKTVSRDVSGNENVVFTDTDGKTLAAARVGGTPKSYNNQISIGEQGYVDVHVPQGTTGFSIAKPTGVTIEVFDLITELKDTRTTTSLPNGFYRVAVTNLESYNPNPNNTSTQVIVTCKDNYYDYSLNEYNKAGQLIAVYQPVGGTKASKPVSTFTYNALSQLIYMKSPDEGEAWFKYRNDGQIRFSQNSKQKENNTFSYTTYDDLGRPTKSGVHPYSPTILNFDSLDPDLSVLNSVTEEMNISVYDSYENVFYKNPLSNTFDQALTDLGLTTIQKLAYIPSFLAGNVAITYTKYPETTTTWYSYDIYGRVNWIVQNITGLGTKTIDYEYDPVTSAVTKVDFQRYNTNERFVHKYTYNEVNELVKVETSPNASTFTTQAEYSYYETGALKRVALAPLNGTTLQGIDYVYNLNGQLKSINHPELTSGKGPNGETNDLFGMQLNYYKGDYLRENTNIASPAEGIDQYNGNIKSVTWNTKGLGTTTPDSYYYKYNKNNWIEGASFNDPLLENGKVSGVTDFVQTWYYGDFLYSGIGGGSSAKLTAVNNIITFTYGASFSNSHIKTGPVVQINYPVPDVDLGFIRVQKSTGEYYNDKFKVSIVNGWIVVTGEGVYQSYEYKYMSSLTNSVTIIPSAGSPSTISSTGDYNVYNITYDANGNILKLKRNKNTDAHGNAMDNFTYNYKTGKPNQLDHVTDAVIAETGADDLKTQASGNYIYNAIGQLIENVKEGVKYTYNTSGLVTEVSKKDVPLVKFFYNDKGHRVRKEAYSNGSLTKTEYYVRDAAGIVLAIYTGTSQTELPIYGASRLGIYNKQSGNSVYQLTDHLGNVRAVVMRDINSNTKISSATDYYPFGMPMPGKQIVGGELYRYAFQGQEKDPETGKEAFQLRLWDGRIGRWLTTDPYSEFHSPYLGMGNNPVSVIDPDGGCTTCPDNAKIGDTYKHADYGTLTYSEAGWGNNTYGVILDDIVINANIGKYSSDYSELSMTGPYSGHALNLYQNYSKGKFGIDNTISIAEFGAFNNDIGVGGIDANAYFKLASTDINTNYGSNNNVNLSGNGQIGELSAGIQYGLVKNNDRKGFVAGLEAGAYTVRGEASLTFNNRIPLTSMRTQIKAIVGGSALSAHAGGAFQMYYSNSTGMYHLNGAFHIGFVGGFKVGIDSAIGF